MSGVNVSNSGRMFVADVKVDAWIAGGNRIALGLQLQVRGSHGDACESNDEKDACGRQKGSRDNGMDKGHWASRKARPGGIVRPGFGAELKASGRNREEPCAARAREVTEYAASYRCASIGFKITNSAMEAEADPGEALFGFGF